MEWKEWKWMDGMEEMEWRGGSPWGPQVAHMPLGRSGELKARDCPGAGQQTARRAPQGQVAGAQLPRSCLKRQRRRQRSTSASATRNRHWLLNLRAWVSSEAASVRLESMRFSTRHVELMIRSKATRTDRTRSCNQQPHPH